MGPATSGDKPPPLLSFAVVNFGPLPVLDVRLMGPSSAIGYGALRHHDAQDLGTVGPCQVATLSGVDLSPARVEFTDATGRRWSRRQAAPPRPAPSPSPNDDEGEALGATMAVRALPHCR